MVRCFYGRGQDKYFLIIVVHKTLFRRDNTGSEVARRRSETAASYVRVLTCKGLEGLSDATDSPV